MVPTLVSGGVSYGVRRGALRDSVSASSQGRPEAARGCALGPFKVPDRIPASQNVVALAAEQGVAGLLGVWPRDDTEQFAARQLIMRTQSCRLGLVQTVRLGTALMVEPSGRGDRKGTIPRQNRIYSVPVDLTEVLEETFGIDPLRTHPWFVGRLHETTT